MGRIGQIELNGLQWTEMDLIDGWTKLDQDFDFIIILKLFFLGKKFQVSASDDSSLSSDQDTNQFLV